MVSPMKKKRGGGSVGVASDQDGKDIEILQKEYRNMQANRNAFAQESDLVLRKQQQTLEKLRKENETLKRDVATLQTRSALKPISSFERSQLDKLYAEQDKYATLIETEKNRISSMEGQIASLREQVWRKRRSMGGVNAAADNQRLVEKQVRILENRLDQALVKFNKSLAYNRKLREEIDDLRGERVSFDGVYKKLEKELQDKKKQMAQVIEQSNVAYEQRDRAQLEITAIEQANRKEQDAFEQQMAELGTELEELSLASTRRKQAPSRPSPEDEERRAAERKEAARLNEIAREREAHAQQRKEKMQNFEEAFRKIAAATGISDVDELVRAFIANEEQNFSLFTYVNEQANEIAKLEEQVQALRDEEARYKQETGDDADQYQKILDDLDDKIASTDEQADKLERKSDEYGKTLDELKDEIKLLLIRLDCKSDHLGETEVTEANMVNFLGIIEDRTNELLSTYQRIKASSDRTKEANNEGAPDSFDFTPDAMSTTDEPRLSLLGSGPDAPMGADPIYVNPPRLTDYSSDENSGDEAGGDSSFRILSRTELKNKTEAKQSVRRRVTATKGVSGGRRRSTVMGMNGASGGRRGSLLSFETASS